MRRLIWPTMMLIAVSACSAPAGGSDRPSPDQTDATTPSPESSGKATVPARILDEIVADAAKRAGVDAAAVTVLSAEQRTWGDASLGCPQPGMYYTQVTVDGYRVVVSAGGVQYDYRAGAGRLRVCEVGARSS